MGQTSEPFTHSGWLCDPETRQQSSLGSELRSSSCVRKGHYSVTKLAATPFAELAGKSVVSRNKTTIALYSQSDVDAVVRGMIERYCDSRCPFQQRASREKFNI